MKVGFSRDRKPAPGVLKRSPRGNAEGTSVLMFNAFEVYGDFHIPTDS